MALPFSEHHYMRGPTADSLDVCLPAQMHIAYVGHIILLGGVPQLPVLVGPERVHSHVGVQKDSEVMPTADLPDGDQ